MKTPETTLFELYAVMAVSSHRSFRKAADELGVSTSALSHSIAALETRIGVRLFNRTTRSVSISDAGKSFLQRISPAIQEIELAVENANEFRDSPKGNLRISTSEVAAKIAFYPAFSSFLARFPEVKLELVIQEQLVDIVEEGLDAGIRLVDSVPKDMIAVPFGPAEFRPLVVASPEYLAQYGEPQTPDELNNHNCIAYRFSTGQVYNWEFMRDGIHTVIRPGGNVIVNELSVAIKAAKCGTGIAYINDWSIKAELEKGELVTVLSAWCLPFSGLALYYPGHRLVPSGLRALIDVLREEQGYWE